MQAAGLLTGEDAAPTVPHPGFGDLEVGQVWAFPGGITSKSQLPRTIDALVPGSDEPEVRWSHVGFRVKYWCSVESFTRWVVLFGAVPVPDDEKPEVARRMELAVIALNPPRKPALQEAGPADQVVGV